MKIRICLVKWVIDIPGGGEKVAISLANELSNNPNFDIHLVGITSESAHPFFPISDKVRYTNFCCQSPRPKLYRYGFKAARQLKSYIKRNQIDIVMSIGISTNGITLAATYGTKAKLVVCEHLNGQAENNRTPNIIRRYLGAKLSDMVVTLTDEDRLYYCQKYRLSKDKVVCIPNWIEETSPDIAYNSTSKRLITIGRFSKQKGYDLLAKVASQVLNKHADWIWDIYGSGDEVIRQSLVNQLEDSGVLSQVDFKGVVSGSENIYPEHGIYVMTSYYEGLPLVLLEAKQFGLPIVSFSCPTGPADIVENGVNGDLIPPFDVDNMIERLNHLMSHQEIREQYSASAQNGMTRFNKETVLSQWEDLVTKLKG